MTLLLASVLAALAPAPAEAGAVGSCPAADEMGSCPSTDGARKATQLEPPALDSQVSAIVVGCLILLWYFGYLWWRRRQSGPDSDAPAEALAKLSAPARREGFDLATCARPFSEGDSAAELLPADATERARAVPSEEACVAPPA